MNRRKLLQSLASIVAIPFTVKGMEGVAFPLEKGKKYLFLADPRTVDLDSMHHGLMSLGIEGVLQAVEEPETSMKIYEVA